VEVPIAPLFYQFAVLGMDDDGVVTVGDVEEGVGRQGVDAVVR
jgi:hypothetical protein